MQVGTYKHLFHVAQLGRCLCSCGCVWVLGGPSSSILACTVIVSFAKGLRKGESAFVVVEMTLFSCQEVFQSSIWMDRECYLNEIL